MTKRIILCDDEIHILRAAEFKLKRAGYEVTIASDGQEAWERIKVQPPDILVTDCQMPRLDGLGLIRRVRENPATRHLPILMLTAKGYELPSEELARQWNVMGVIPKPFSPRELLQTVEKILGGARQGEPTASPVMAPAEPAALVGAVMPRAAGASECATEYATERGASRAATL